MISVTSLIVVVWLVAAAVRHAGRCALIASLKKLLARNAAPRSDPLYTVFHSSHPPPGRRVAVLEQAANIGPD